MTTRVLEGCSGPLIAAFSTNCLTLWLIVFNISIIYTPAAILQDCIIHLHIATSALCQKRWYHGRWHAHTSVSGKEHYPHMHENNWSATAVCLLPPFPPCLFLHPRFLAIVPVNWGWRGSGTPWDSCSCGVHSLMCNARGLRAHLQHGGGLTLHETHNNITPPNGFTDNSRTPQPVQSSQLCAQYLTK